MSDFVPNRLRKAADIYAERNAIYGDNYKHFGKVVEALFPNGVNSVPGADKAEQYNRLGVLIQIISKLTRYCAQFEKGGHADSLDDLAVYACMLQELDSGE